MAPNRMSTLALSSFAAMIIPTMSGKSVPMSPNAPASSFRSNRIAPSRGATGGLAVRISPMRGGFFDRPASGLADHHFRRFDHGHDLVADPDAHPLHGRAGDHRDESFWPIWTRTSAITPPREIAVTRPRNWLRALISTSTSFASPGWGPSLAISRDRGKSHFRPILVPGSCPALASAWIRFT